MTRATTPNVAINFATIDADNIDYLGFKLKDLIWIHVMFAIDIVNVMQMPMHLS